MIYRRVFVLPSPLPFARPRALALASNLYLPALAPTLCYLVLPPCVTLSYPKFVFTSSARNLSLHIPTVSPQFLFAGPDLRFVRTQASKLIYPQ